MFLNHNIVLYFQIHINNHILKTHIILNIYFFSLFKSFHNLKMEYCSFLSFISYLMLHYYCNLKDNLMNFTKAFFILILLINTLFLIFLLSFLLMITHNSFHFMDQIMYHMQYIYVHLHINLFRFIIVIYLNVYTILQFYLIFISFLTY